MQKHLFSLYKIHDDSKIVLGQIWPIYCLFFKKSQKNHSLRIFDPFVITPVQVCLWWKQSLLDCILNSFVKTMEYVKGLINCQKTEMNYTIHVGLCLSYRNLHCFFGCNLNVEWLNEWNKITTIWKCFDLLLNKKF